MLVALALSRASRPRVRTFAAADNSVGDASLLSFLKFGKLQLAVLLHSSAGIRGNRGVNPRCRAPDGRETQTFHEMRKEVTVPPRNSWR